jgi:GxxExxY protein
MEIGVDQITYAIRGCAFDVYNQLGPGLREMIYQRALASQLQHTGWQCEAEREVDVRLDGLVVTKQKLDLLVEDRVIVEIKAEKELLPLDEAQIITYLKVTGLKIGLLINFGSRPIQIKRFIN